MSERRQPKYSVMLPHCFCLDANILDSFSVSSASDAERRMGMGLVDVGASTTVGYLTSWLVWGAVIVV